MMAQTRESRARRDAGAAPLDLAAELPAEPTQAVRFGKARMAQSSALFEDYVELIADLLDAYGEARTTEVAKRLGVTHPTAVKGLGRLKREGLATSRPYRGIFLTEAGRSLADRVRARHRLVVKLLAGPRRSCRSRGSGCGRHGASCLGRDAEGLRPLPCRSSLKPLKLRVAPKLVRLQGQFRPIASMTIRNSTRPPATTR